MSENSDDFHREANHEEITKNPINKEALAAVFLSLISQPANRHDIIELFKNVELENAHEIIPTVFTVEHWNNEMIYKNKFDLLTCILNSPMLNDTNTNIVTLQTEESFKESKAENLQTEMMNLLKKHHQTFDRVQLEADLNDIASGYTNLAQTRAIKRLYRELFPSIQFEVKKTLSSLIAEIAGGNPHYELLRNTANRKAAYNALSYLRYQNGDDLQILTKYAMNLTKIAYGKEVTEVRGQIVSNLPKYLIEKIGGELQDEIESTISDEAWSKITHIVHRTHPRKAQSTYDFDLRVKSKYLHSYYGFITHTPYANAQSNEDANLRSDQTDESDETGSAEMHSHA